MDYNTPNNPNTAPNKYEERPSRLPLFLTLFVLAALAIVAIVAITPRETMPLVTNDQVSPAAGDVTASPSTTPSDTAPMVDGGPVTDADRDPTSETNPDISVQSTDTGQPMPEADGAGGTPIAP